MKNLQANRKYYIHGMISIALMVCIRFLPPIGVLTPLGPDHCADYGPVSLLHVQLRHSRDSSDLELHLFHLRSGGLYEKGCLAPDDGCRHCFLCLRGLRHSSPLSGQCGKLWLPGRPVSRTSLPPFCCRFLRASLPISSPASSLWLH